MAKVAILVRKTTAIDIDTAILDQILLMFVHAVNSDKSALSITIFMVYLDYPRAIE